MKRQFNFISNVVDILVVDDALCKFGESMCLYKPYISEE